MTFVTNPYFIRPYDGLKPLTPPMGLFPLQGVQGNLLAYYNDPQGAKPRRIFVSGDGGANYTEIGGEVAPVTSAWNYRAMRADGTFVSAMYEDISRIGAGPIGIVRGNLSSAPAATGARFPSGTFPMTFGSDGSKFVTLTEGNRVYHSADGVEWTDVGRLELPYEFGHIDNLNFNTYSTNYSGSWLRYFNNKWIFAVAGMLFVSDDPSARANWVRATMPAPVFVETTPTVSPWVSNGNIVQIGSALFCVSQELVRPLTYAFRVLKSVDGGYVWTRLPNAPQQLNTMLAVLNGVLLIYGNANTYVNISRDSGETWETKDTDLFEILPELPVMSNGKVTLKVGRNPRVEGLPPEKLVYTTNGVNFLDASIPSLKVEVNVEKYATTGVRTTTTFASVVDFAGDTLTLAAVGGTGANVIFYRYTRNVSLVGYGGVGVAGASPKRVLTDGDISYALFSDGVDATPRILRVDRRVDPRNASHTHVGAAHAPYDDLIIGATCLWATCTSRNLIYKLRKEDLSVIGSFAAYAFALAEGDGVLYAVSGGNCSVFNNEGALLTTFNVTGKVNPIRVLYDRGRLFIQREYTYVYDILSKVLIATLDTGPLSMAGNELMTGLTVYNRETLRLRGKLEVPNPVRTTYAMGDNLFYVGMYEFAGNTNPVGEVWTKSN